MRIAYSIVAGIFALLATQSLKAELPWERWVNLRSIARVDGQSSSLLYSSYCLDGCRFDRTSVEPDRGGPRFLRYESTPGGVEAIAFEDFGPGAITRIWMTMGFGTSERLDPNVRIRIYVDGAVVPVVDTPLPQFFDGSVPPFVPPLTYDRLNSSGGNVSYTPIPYQSSVKVGLLNAAEARIWFQFNYTRLPVAMAAEVTPFSADMRFPTLEALLADTGRSLWAGRYVYRPTLGTWSPPATATAGWLSESNPSIVIYEAEGQGWIDEVAVNLLRSHWHAVDIEIEVDGNIAVAVPLVEFFAVDPLGQVQPRGLFAGQDTYGGLYARWPIPHRRNVVMRLKRSPQATSSTYVRFEVASSPGQSVIGAAPFRISARTSCPSTTPDFSLFDHQGSGRIVGLMAYKMGDGTRPGAYFLEGDERLYIDGSQQPLWYGTGTEDLFNGGFYYDQGPFTLPLHGSPTRTGGGVNFASTAYRWFLTDAPEWREAIDFRLEAGALGFEPFCARSVVYYYAHAREKQTVLAALDLVDPASVAAAAYTPPPTAHCEIRSGSFGSEPPAQRDYRVCEYGSGVSRFSFDIPLGRTTYRLRRTFDASINAEGGQAAEVWINGVLVGYFPPVQANPHRRWQQLDADLKVNKNSGPVHIEIRPLGSGFSDARYELFGEPVSAAVLARAMAWFPRNEASPPR